MNNESTKLTELRLKEARSYIKKQYKINVTEARLRHWIRRGLLSHGGDRIYLYAKRDWCWHVCRQSIDLFIKKQGEQEQKNVRDTKKKDTEKLLSLKQAQKHIQREYQLDVTIPQLRCWIKLGRVSNSNRRYRLGAKKRCGLYRGWFTTKKQIDAFVTELDT